MMGNTILPLSFEIQEFSGGARPHRNGKVYFLFSKRRCVEGLKN